jgi:ring-1,2-phenylacetyl-CoA epoxidase subunit PaaC
MNNNQDHAYDHHLFEYCLRLGDTSLILGQRLGAWCGHGPALEEDIALSNIALDLIGQARNFLTYACQVEGKGRNEDDLAFHRDERQFRNLLMAEQPNGDFAVTIARQFFLSVYMFHLYDSLKKSVDKTISAIAEKSWKEVAYHLRHSNDWMLRLGDGTKESNTRLQEAVNGLWVFVDDLFHADETERFLLSQGIAADPEIISNKWHQQVNDVFLAAKLTIPSSEGFMRKGSREGVHTEHLGFILSEMQFLPRAYPDAKW